MSDGETRKYFGIYRGTVVDNVDPMLLGRISVTVPGLSSIIIPFTWAMPCVPITGIQMGTFMVPQIGAGVWIQFEAGDPDYPVWTGGWWRTPAEVPDLAYAGLPGDPNIVLQTSHQNALVISDLPGPTGGIMLKSENGATIVVNDTGIYLENGKGASLIMVGPTVDVNHGALVVV